MITAKQLYQAYKETGYFSFLPLTIQDAITYINGHASTCERNSLTIIVEYFYDWGLSTWEGEDLVV